MATERLFDDVEYELVAADDFLSVASEFIEEREASDNISLDTIVDLIEVTQRRGDIFSLLIQGLSGHGKTTLALKLAAKFYSRRTGGSGWYKALRYLHFDPLSILSTIMNHMRRGKLVPLLIFDDAGAWLSKWGITVEKRFFLEFSNLLRESVGAIIYTDIYSIQKYVRDTVKLRAVVKKVPREQYEAFGISRDDEREWSLARFYVTVFTFNGPRWKRLVDIVYPLDIPPHIRSKYRKKRLEYTARLAKRVMTRLLSSSVVKKMLRDGDEIVTGLVREFALAAEDYAEEVEE